MRHFLFGGIMRNLLETIYEKVRAGHAYQSMEDLYYMSKEAMKNDTALGVESLSVNGLCATGRFPGSRCG